jgi:two-component system copper resistance phosphate regulon response regulator CusR
MEKQISILLAEDEVKLNQIIKTELASKGYKIDAVLNGLDAETLISKNNYSLILLDIGLPGKTGLQLCKLIRLKSKRVPIIMLTAFGEVQDKVDAFELGADDYIVKPFHFDELLARIKALLKRAAKPNNNDDIILKLADLEIHNKTKTVYRAGQEIALTAKEFSFLKLLVENRGKVISKQEILEKVWDLSFDTGTNTIEVYINFLRNKIDKPFEEKLICTKSGFGYYIK